MFTLPEIITLLLYAATVGLLLLAQAVSGALGRVAALLSLLTGVLASYALFAIYTGEADHWLAHQPRAEATMRRADNASSAPVGLSRSSVSAGAGAQDGSDRANGAGAVAASAPDVDRGGSDPVGERVVGSRSTLASFRGARRSLLDEPSFRDCPVCPEMQALPPAFFPIGAVAGDRDAQPSERPRRTGQLRRPFAIGRYEIKLAEYEAFRSATGHPAPACPGRRQIDALAPVHCVSHADARAYTAWLGALTGQRYRLPSAAEWEYAARSGSGAAYSSGPRLSPLAAHASLDAAVPLAVGSRAPNAFGLHDMTGNVAELVADCWTDDLAAVPTDGKPAFDRTCRRRTLKDGSWNEPEHWMRASARRPIDPAVAVPGVGFRVVREMR